MDAPPPPLHPGDGTPPGGPPVRDPGERYRLGLEETRELLHTFDAMRVRPPYRNGDRPTPILQVTGPYRAASAVVQAFQERCKGTPFALLRPRNRPAAAEGVRAAQRPRPYAPLEQQLRKAAEALAAVAPRGEAHLRFPLLHQVLWMLDLRITERDLGGLRELFKKEAGSKSRGVRGRGGQDRRTFWANVRAYAEGPLQAWVAAGALISVGWAESLTTLLGVVAVLGAVTVGVLHVLLLSRAWAGRHRYRWFRRQPYLMGGEWRNQRRDLTGFGARVLEARLTAESRPEGNGSTPHAGGAADQHSEAAQATADIEHLLVNAFLEDLRQGYVRHLWRIWRRVTFARTTYPVLLVEGAGSHLVRRIEEVRADTRQRDPLLVVEVEESDRQSPADEPPAAAPVPAGPPGAVGPGSAQELWDEWQATLARDRALGSVRVLRVEVTPDHVAHLEKADKGAGGRRRPRLAHPLLPWATVMALVGGSLFYVTTSDSCAPGVWEAASGECVGVSDGGYVFHPRIKNLLDEIHKTNREIKASGRPYATVVYFSTLSLPPSAIAAGQNLSSDSPGELAGIAAEQRRLAENGDDSSKLQMRVLVANAGDRYRFAGAVAQKIVDLIPRDPTIVGAIGFAESRQQVQETIQLLSRRALPMISMTGTFDDLGRRGAGGSYAPSFFPLAPPNSALAGGAARWAKEGIPEYGIKPKRRAVVFRDGTADDLYGRDLGDRFITAFGPGATPVTYADAADIEPEVVAACSAKQQPDLMFYAGRAGQFGTFVDAISKSRCHKVTIMAGDTVTQYVNDHAVQLGRNPRVRLFYTPLASLNAWDTVSAEYRSDFSPRLRDLLSSIKMDHLPVTQQPSKEYAVMAQDAADTLMRAAQNAYSAQYRPAGDTPETGVLDRGGVLLALEKLPPIDGDSGLVKLHGGPDGHHALDRPVLLVTTNERGEQVVVRRCGRLYHQQEQEPKCRV